MATKIKSGIHIYSNTASFRSSDSKRSVYGKYEQGGVIRLHNYNPTRAGYTGSVARGFIKIAPVQLLTWNNDKTVVPK